MNENTQFPLIQSLRSAVSEWSARAALSTLVIGSVIAISTFAGCGVASTTTGAPTTQASAR